MNYYYFKYFGYFYDDTEIMIEIEIAIVIMITIKIGSFDSDIDCIKNEINFQ